MGSPVDLVGQRFGSLVVKKRLGALPGKSQGVHWLCVCDCGGEATPTTSNLRHGTTASCGCSRIGKFTNYKHGAGKRGSWTREFKAWLAMRRRCYDKKLEFYSDYGGRGIKVCEAWREDFAQFLKDVGPAPSPKHTLDRIDNDGDYEPGNVRWATQLEQAQNRRGLHKLTFQGETRTMNDWSRIVGILRETIRYRLKAGWPVEKALTTPSRRKSTCKDA